MNTTCLSLVFVLLAVPQSDDPPPAAAATGSIAGVVRWKGEVPEAKPLPAPTKEETEGCTCTELDLTDRSLLIDPKTKGVANVVLTVRVEGLEVPPPEEPVVIDQRGCHFEPHVAVVRVGGKLRFGNSDETQHNVHTFSRKNQAGNKTIGKGGTYEMLLERREAFQVKCDFHPWMSCWIFVTDATHWAKTDEKGRFAIHGLPPGTYTFSWWHETLGVGRTAEVVVKAGETAELSPEVAPRPSRRRRR